MFGDAENVSYDEYAHLINKLMELRDVESAIRLREKYDDLVEEYSDNILTGERDYTPREPVLTTRKSMAETDRKSKEAFPETYARIQEMLDMGQKRIDEMRYNSDKEGAREERKNHVTLSLGLLDKIKDKITEESWREAGLETYSEWLQCIADLKKIIESDDFMASDVAIKKVNAIYLFSRLNDSKWLVNEVVGLRRNLRK